MKFLLFSLGRRNLRMSWPMPQRHRGKVRTRLRKNGFCSKLYGISIWPPSALLQAIDFRAPRINHGEPSQQPKCSWQKQTLTPSGAKWMLRRSTGERKWVLEKRVRIKRASQLFAAPNLNAQKEIRKKGWEFLRFPGPIPFKYQSITVSNP